MNSHLLNWSLYHNIINALPTTLYWIQIENSVLSRPMRGEYRSLCPHPIQDYLLTYLQWLTLLPRVVFITYMLSSKDALPYNQKTKWGRDIMQQKAKSHCLIPQGIVDLMYQGHPYLCTNPNLAQGLTQKLGPVRPSACLTCVLYNCHA